MIITTHYIEEAINSDFVAFLRNGKLVCEQNPQDLMFTYNTVNLEDAMYAICNSAGQMDKNEAQNETINSIKPNSFIKENKSRTEQLKNFFFCLYIVTIRTWKIYLSLYHNVLILTVFQLLTAIVSVIAFWKEPDGAPIGVFSTDSPFNNVSLADNIIRSITANEQTVMVRCLMDLHCLHIDISLNIDKVQFKGTDGGIHSKRP